MPVETQMSNGGDATLGPTLRRVGIFAGASSIDSSVQAPVQAFLEGAIGLDLAFVYGGGRTGLMGLVEKVALGNGIPVTGIIAAGGEGSEIYSSLLPLEVVADRAARKQGIIDRADVLVALPGGSGTLEEIVEAWSLLRQGRHRKRCVVFNPLGFFDPLLLQVARMREHGLLGISTSTDIVEVASMAELFDSGRSISI